MWRPSFERCRRPVFRSPILALLATITAVSVGLVASGCESGNGGGEPNELNGMTRTPPNEVGKLRLPQANPESDNRAGALAGRSGGVMLVYFGFTSCPDVCPTTLADLRLALEELDEEDRSRVRVAMITVDPERDSAEVLNEYLGHFFPARDFSSLRTTDRERLRATEKVFGASHRIGPPDSEGDYDVSHTAQLYAVDDEGTVVVEWPFATEPSAMASDLAQLLGQAPEDDET